MSGKKWLIWSHHHNAWHRRGMDGGANGYAADLAGAGLFDEEVARQYHDDPCKSDRRDEMIDPADRLTQIKGALLRNVDQIDRLLLIAEAAGMTVPKDLTKPLR
jgi:hypothetical protein